MFGSGGNSGGGWGEMIKKMLAKAKDANTGKAAESAGVDKKDVNWGHRAGQALQDNIKPRKGKESKDEADDEDVMSAVQRYISATRKNNSEKRRGRPNKYGGGNY